jgi:hypothetical protein
MHGTKIKIKVVVKFMAVIVARLLLADGCDFIADLSPCRKNLLKLSAVYHLRTSVYVLAWEVVVKLIQAGFREIMFCRPSYA